MYDPSLTMASVDEDLARAAGREAEVDWEAVYPFGDLSQLLEGLLKLTSGPSCTLISVGHVTPEVALAANGAEIELVEALSESPFAGDVAAALKAVRADTDIFYLANPNRVTGAAYSRADVRRLCAVIAEGTVIVDERLTGVGAETAVPLLENLTNLIVLRSFRALAGEPAGNAGFVVAGQEMIEAIGESAREDAISRALRDKILGQRFGDGDWKARVNMISHESLRIATELTRIGIQCRTTPTDFLLIRVANVKDTGNFLTASQVAIENLDGYPQMRHYLRYRLESPERNDKLVDAFRSMPCECYRSVALDKSKVKRYRGADRGNSGRHENHVAAPKRSV